MDVKTININDSEFIVEIDKNDNVFYIYSKNLGKHFENKQLMDFLRYIEVNQKTLNKIGFDLIKNKDNRKILNKITNDLNNILLKHYDFYFKDGYLKNKYYHYSVIAYRCCDVPRKHQTVNYINQVLGVYANLI